MPVIILGGIHGSSLTVTEAVMVAVVYGIFIGSMVYRELKIEKLWVVFRDNAASIADTTLIMCPAKATGSVLAYLNINQIIADFMFSISSNYHVVMSMIFIIIFIVGIFMQTTPAIIILAPTLLSITTQVGCDPIHPGIILGLALVIVFVTPPVAINLFVGSLLTDISIGKIIRAEMSLLFGLIAASFTVAFIPAISLLLLGRI